MHRVRIYSAVCLAAAAAVGSPSAFATKHALVAPTVIARAADQMLSDIDPAGPGAVVVITTGAKTIYAGARGLASVELGVPLTVDSVFRIGSITKSFTAAAILALADQHRLVLDAPIAQWLPDFPRAKDITVQQLLSHTAGVSDGWEAPLTEHLDTTKRLALIGSKPLDFEPGTDWHYSNSGFMLLGAMLEKVTGRPWYDAVTEAMASMSSKSSLTRMATSRQSISMRRVSRQHAAKLVLKLHNERSRISCGCAATACPSATTTPRSR